MPDPSPPRRTALHTAEKVELETRQAWRAWLADNHARPDGVWLVSWRRHTGRPAMTYDDVVEEALCFGWVDSTAKTLDEDRSMLYLAPRRRGSGWSRPNKIRIERLEDAGAIAEPGRRVIEAARLDGSWTLLDDAEALVVPPDLSAAFDRYPGSRGGWEALPASARKQALGWIALAKREQTRARRVEQAASAAQRGERPVA
jgi:uncharacterized protein YdeI (YjbR/CyaY-like superfamily)